MKPPADPWESQHLHKNRSRQPLARALGSVLILTSGLLFAHTSGQASTLGPMESAQGNHDAHVAAVAKAQKQGAYAITSATNGCPAPTLDILGWPAAMVRQCIYSKGGLTGYVLLLDVKPEVIATWIETECARVLPGNAKCFQTVLSCAHGNSGMMFPISGNMMENMDNKPWKNYFFRNGMSVRMPDQPNGTQVQVPIDRQKELALMSDKEIVSIPSGLTRFWRTTPAQFATRFPSETIPKTLGTAQARQQWLDIARAEFLSALSRPENRLLEAWIAAHPKTLGVGNCPKDEDP